MQAMSFFPRWVGVLLCAALSANTVFAQQPQGKAERDSAAGGSAQLSEVGQGQHMGRKELQPGAYFSDRHRQAVRDYYAQACAPGQASGETSCRPSGQVRRWQIGQALPKGALASDLPRAMLARLPPQPPGLRYVRVTGDILLIAAGTQMVVDAVEDPRRM